MSRTVLVFFTLWVTLVDAEVVVAQRQGQPGVPSLRYGEASGCGGLFLYTWSADRSEVMTIRADRAALPLPDGTTTVRLAGAGDGVAVRVEVTDASRDSLPFCSEEQAAAGETPVIWTAVAGTVKFTLRRRPNAAFTPVSVSIDDLVLRSPDRPELKQRRAIQFTAAIADLDK